MTGFYFPEDIDPSLVESEDTSNGCSRQLDTIF
jgi:hypothetical protein